MLARPVALSGFSSGCTRVARDHLAGCWFNWNAHSVVAFRFFELGLGELGLSELDLGELGGLGDLGPGEAQKMIVTRVCGWKRL